MEPHGLLLLMIAIVLTFVSLYGIYVKLFTWYVLVIPTIIGVITYGAFHLLTS